MCTDIQDNFFYRYSLKFTKNHNKMENIANTNSHVSLSLKSLTPLHVLMHQKLEQY